MEYTRKSFTLRISHKLKKPTHKWLSHLSFTSTGLSVFDTVITHLTYQAPTLSSMRVSTVWSRHKRKNRVVDSALLLFWWVLDAIVGARRVRGCERGSKEVDMRLQWVDCQADSVGGPIEKRACGPLSRCCCAYVGMFAWGTLKLASLYKWSLNYLINHKLAIYVKQARLYDGMVIVDLALKSKSWTTMKTKEREEENIIAQLLLIKHWRAQCDALLAFTSGFCASKHTMPKWSPEITQ